ncbi:2-oxoglutarate dehydrogenase, E2 component, dihydrolipoamide succinyltransferase [Corynebacterium bovis]|uniref:2-oxoglutarate dehydrogenase, E2 component, dihydrolipoamide succinyltransferase n=1 Tax=Corynebacterium bovis TaxID=36808 RepID=UPI0031386DD4
MAHSVEMPELGESVTEGTITQWLKSVGDTVEVDEPLLEVSTDKVDTEIPAPVAGTLLKILAEEDDTVDVGAVIAEIGDSDEAPSGDDANDSGSSDSDDAADAGSSASDEASDDDGADSSASDDSSDDAAASDDSGSAAPSGSGDATDVTMPELGESVSEGTITQWLKSVGDTVAVDEPLLEVSTDKVDTEVPSPVEGTLLEILAQEDDTVDVGAVIARVGDASAAPSGGDSAGTDGKNEATAEKAEEKAPEKPEPKSEDKPAEKAEEKAEVKSEDTSEKKAPEAPAASSSSSQSSTGTEPGEGSLPYVTPLVRKLAEKHKVDLSKVTGSGVGGRIRKQDVLAAAEDTTPATGAAGAGSPAGSRASTKSVDPAKAELRGTTRKVNRIRAITAKTTLTSLHSAAQLTQVHEVDMTHVAELRKARKQAFRDTHGVNLTYLPFFAKAIGEALVSHPNINASYNAETQEMTYHDKVNLGIAVDTPEGLLSPVIHDAQDMSLPELAKAIVDLADRARNKKLKPNDIAGGTFTITNIGSEGALTDTPILVPPQAAMIGTGAIVKRPVVISEDDSDSIAIRQMVLLPMTYDHQVIDGADAGRFLTTVRDRLETADFEDDLGL